MTSFRVIAIPTKVALLARSSKKSPGYGHPVHIELATGYGPCRHCLRAFRIGQEQRLLFTYDPFYGSEPIPLPGPVFIHLDPCDRYVENAGYPADMLSHEAVLNAYAEGQVVVAREVVREGEHEAAVQRILALENVSYIEVRDKQAGCYDFRIQMTS